ncbi:MAG: hypothetical protein RR365_08010 [Bacteroides sp.]
MRWTECCAAAATATPTAAVIVIAIAIAIVIVVVFFSLLFLFSSLLKMAYGETPIGSWFHGEPYGGAFVDYFVFFFLS